MMVAGDESVAGTTSNALCSRVMDGQRQTDPSHHTIHMAYVLTHIIHT